MANTRLGAIEEAIEKFESSSHAHNHHHDYEEVEDGDSDGDNSKSFTIQQWLASMVTKLLRQFRRPTRRIRARGYKRLNNKFGTRLGRTHAIRAGSQSHVPLPSGRIRIQAKPRVRWQRLVPLSPSALLTRIRNAYVRLLLAAEAKMTLQGGISMAPFGPSSTRATFFPPNLPKEYDPKVLVQLYASSLKQC